MIHWKLKTNPDHPGSRLIAETACLAAKFFIAFFPAMHTFEGNAARWSAGSYQYADLLSCPASARMMSSGCVRSIVRVGQMVCLLFPLSYPDAGVRSDDCPGVRVPCASWLPGIMSEDRSIHVLCRHTRLLHGHLAGCPVHGYLAFNSSDDNELPRYEFCRLKNSFALWWLQLDDMPLGLSPDLARSCQISGRRGGRTSKCIPTSG